MIKMYWKDELDALYQKNEYGKRLWKKLEGKQVELLLRNNQRKLGTVVEVLDSTDGLKVQFQHKELDNTLVTWMLDKKEIKYVDPFLK
jgi:hypothetical protein